MLGSGEGDSCGRVVVCGAGFFRNLEAGVVDEVGEFIRGGSGSVSRVAEVEVQELVPTQRKVPPLEFERLPFNMSRATSSCCRGRVWFDQSERSVPAAPVPVVDFVGGVDECHHSGKRRLAPASMPGATTRPGQLVHQADAYALQPRGIAL